MEEEKELLEFFEQIIPDDLERTVITEMLKGSHEEDVVRSLLSHKALSSAKKAKPKED